jgi:hypothetical protein
MQFCPGDERSAIAGSFLSLCFQDIFALVPVLVLCVCTGLISFRAKHENGSEDNSDKVELQMQRMSSYAMAAVLLVFLACEVFVERAYILHLVLLLLQSLAWGVSSKLLARAPLKNRTCQVLYSWWSVQLVLTMLRIYSLRTDITQGSWQELMAIEALVSFPITFCLVIFSAYKVALFVLQTKKDGPDPIREHSMNNVVEQPLIDEESRQLDLSFDAAAFVVKNKRTQKDKEAWERWMDLSIGPGDGSEDDQQGHSLNGNGNSDQARLSFPLQSDDEEDSLLGSISLAPPPAEENHFAGSLSFSGGVRPYDPSSSAEDQHRCREIALTDTKQLVGLTEHMSAMIVSAKAPIHGVSFPNYGLGAALCCKGQQIIDWMIKQRSVNTH